ncbi:MAG: hypothetical protein IKK91_05760 [Ruminococcus sp.]|nr:hypothetical protein [Ruminococcus sp.]
MAILCIMNVGANCVRPQTTMFIDNLRADVGIRPYIRNKTKNMFAHENFTHTSQVQDDFALYGKRTLNLCTEDIKFLLPNLLTLPFIGSII